MAHRYFLITGLHKSGTTWVQRLCDAHPDAVCRAEDQFPKMGEGLFRAVHDYDATIARADRERDGQGTVSFTDLDVASTLFHLVRLALDKAPETVSCSGTKDNLMNADGFLRFLPGSKVIQIARDPRDIAVSSWASNLRLGGHAPTQIDSPPWDWIEKTSKAWSEVMGQVSRRTAAFPDRAIVIRYEDLLGDFTSTARRMFSFLGLAHDDALLAELADHTSFHKLSGGRPAGEENARSFFRRGVAGDWREKMRPEDAERLSARLSKQLAEFGYPRD